MKILREDQIRIKVLRDGLIGHRINGSKREFAEVPEIWAVSWFKKQIDKIKGKRDMLTAIQYDEMYAAIEDAAREEIGQIDVTEQAIDSYITDVDAEDKLANKNLSKTAGRLLSKAGLVDTEWRRVDLIRRCSLALATDFVEA